MTDQTPEIVAAADVSPVSPKPIHTSATSPALVPSLQDHAATLDVAYLDSLTTAPFPFVTMPPTPSVVDLATGSAELENSQPSPVADTIVVRADDGSDGSNAGDEVIDDESLDAYGEEDDAQLDGASSAASSHVQPAAESGVGDGSGRETETASAQPDLTGASSESMINTPSATSSSEPNDLINSQSPAAVPSHSAEADVATASANGTADDPPGHGETSIETQTAVDDPATKSDVVADAIPAGVDHQGDSAGVDIQKLVESITARAAAPPSSATTSSEAPSEAAASSAKPPVPSISLPQSSSLPPKPALPQQARQSGSRPEDFHPFPSRGSNNSNGPPPMPMQGMVQSHAAPNSSIPYNAGVATNGVSSLPPIPPTSFNGGSDHYAPFPSTVPASTAGVAQREPLQGAQLQQAWEAFQEDEKRYLTEANWGRFPDNSRIFIGNLSSERVSKREVFELFHRFGRLAQISLKSAYGFVQYHSAEDAAAAMQAAQGAEMGGRKIHLEFSRVQKKKDPQDRDLRERSPDRRGARGPSGPLRGGVDRYDGRDRDRDQGRRRDDYRPGRSPSPRRDDAYGRSGHDRRHSGPYERNSRHRSRSGSPRSGRYGQDSYRRRSPSPRRRRAPEPHLDIPERYGDQVPDVQLILLQEVQRDFVSWVQAAFYERGLKTNDMYLNPRFSRDNVIHKLVVQGVYGVIELDARSPAAGKIPLRVFHRSAGNSVRFDDYQDLEPKVAAELVLRAKQQQALPPPPPQPAYPAYPANPYSHPQYPQPYPPSQVPVAGYPYAQQPLVAQPAQTALSAQDIAGLAGKIDNNTLQALLASLPASQQAPQAAGMPLAGPGAASQVDINTLLSGLHGAPGAGPAHPLGPTYGYMPHPSGTPGAPTAGYAQPGLAGTSGVDTAAQVQNIMNSLAKHR